MGWINKFWDRLNPPVTPEQRAVLPWNVYGDADPGVKTVSGTIINEHEAFKHSIVWAAVTLIADGIAALPPSGYRTLEDGSEEKAKVPPWIIKPDREMRRYEVYNQILVSMLMWGNAYCTIIRRDSDDVIVGIKVLDPASVTVEWDPLRPGYRRYKVSPSNIWLSSREIMHFQGPTSPGEAKGMSVITHAREAIGLGLTLEEYAARYFGQGSMAKIVIEMPNKVDSDEAQRIVRTYERFHKGRGNWHRPAIVSGGAKLHNISVNPDDAQFLESRTFQAEEISRWFRVPLHRLNLMTKATSWGSGLAEENKMMLQHTYHPWIQRIEDTFSAYTSGGEGRGVLIRLKTDELVHGTYKDQSEIWLALYQGGLTTKNESRRKIGLEDVESGDEFIDPLLMQTPTGMPLNQGAPSKTEDKDRKQKEKDSRSFEEGEHV